MRTKRLIATALAAAMIFGLVSMGFASDAPLSDVVGHEFEDEIRALAGLKVIEGYTDGTFKPEGTLTRAEYTALIARILGLESMAKAMKGETVPFSDVDGSHWASGYILLAEALGVVNGYPDGTFKPENTVSYAEAIKMTLTAMGYKEEGFPVLRWPVTWLLKANEIELDDDVTVLADFPILRADVAKVLHNSLKLAHVKVKADEKAFEDLTTKEDETVNFLSKLGLTSKEGQVVSSRELWSVTKDKIKVLWDDNKEGDPKEFDFDNYEGLLGHKVKVWFDDKDDVVYHIEKLSTEKELTWEKYDDMSSSNQKKIKEAGFFIKNHQVQKLVNEDKEAIDIELKKGFEDIVVIYDKDDKPVAVKALDYEIGTVSETYVYGDSRKDIYFKDENDDTPDTLRLAKAEVEYFGVDDFGDIKEDDIVHFITYKDSKDVVKRALVIVARDIYKGTVTEIISDKEWKVDGKIFEIDEDVVAFEGEPVGAKVTLYLDKDGKVFKVTGTGHGEAAEEQFYGVVQKVVGKLVENEPKYFYSILVKYEKLDADYVVEEIEYENGEKVAKVGDFVYMSDENLTICGLVYETLDDENELQPLVVTGVEKKKITFKDVDGTTHTVEDYDAVLWLEGKAGKYQVRPRPHLDDKVVLYKVDSGENDIVIGVVQ